MTLLTEEDGSQAADDAPGERLLAAEPSQPWVEHLSAVPAVDPAGLVARWDNEELGRDDRGGGSRHRRRIGEERACVKLPAV